MTVSVFGSTSTAPGTTGTFPSADTVPATGSVLDSQMATAQQIAGSLTAAAFTSDYMSGSTSEAAQFITSGKVNPAGIQWIAYKLLPESDRIALQDQMVTAGVLSVTGTSTSTSDSAFRGLLGVAQSQNTTAGNLLALANDNGIGPIQQQLSANIAAATKEESAPITADVSNPSTIEAQANQAWTQTLGYAPSESQLSGMVSLIQGQDVTAAEAPRDAAKEALSQAQSEESTLNKLGPDGVDAVVAAYHAAVNGLNAPGAGTQQGPATGTGAPTSGPYRTPGSPSDGTAASSPGTGGSFPQSQPQSNGALPGVGNAEAAGGPAAESQIKGLGNQVASLPGQAVQLGRDVGQVDNAIGNAASAAGGAVSNSVSGIPNLLHNWLFGSTSSPARASSATGPTKATLTSDVTSAPPIPSATPPSYSAYSHSYGGMFALSPTEWQKAQSLTPSAKDYTAGTAPQSVQISAFTNLLLDTFQKVGSWSSAVEQIASGTPLGTAKGSHLGSFATDIANQVNSQIESAQTQVSAPITEKVTQPDISAEANQQAKSSDPIGYAASNYSSWAGTLSDMLYGSPTTEQNPASDTFTGPVSPGVAASAPAPVGA